MALMTNKWELALIRCSELERDASIALACTRDSEARTKIQEMMLLIRANCEPMSDLQKVLKERGYTAFFPTMTHYAELFQRFMVCAKEQLELLDRV